MKNTNILILLTVALFTITSSSCKKDQHVVCEKFDWYQDADGDGKGNPDVHLFECEQPLGYVADNTDPIDMVVQKTQVPIVMKISGETCGPCGSWGWTTWSDLSTAMLGKAFCWTTYGSFVSNNHFSGQELTASNNGSKVIQAFQDRFWQSGSKPSFFTNHNDHGTTAADAEAEANTSITEVAKVAAVLDTKIEGDELNLTAEVEFFEDMQGDYVLGAYVIEDKAVGYQAGHADGANAKHHLVMRGSMSDNAWGEALTSNAKKGDKMIKEFNVTLPTTYNKNNLSYGVIIWRKFGGGVGTHLYINAYTTQGHE